ncbi:MAG: DMT family transporter [Paracoccaceae bacterium]
MQTPEISWKSWAMVAALGLTWGGTFLVTEIALDGMTPYWLAAGRICFAVLVMLAIWPMMGGQLFEAPLTGPAAVSVVAIGGFSTAIPFMLLAWGQQFVTSGFAGVSMASVGLLVLPLAHFLVPGERITKRRAIGFLIGFCGVCVLIGGQAFDSTGAELEWAGRIACVTAACCYGVSSVLMRRLPAVDPIGLSTVLLIIAAGMTIPMALWQEGLPTMPDTRTLIVIALLGLIPTAAANLLRVLVIRTAGPVFMSLTNYQVPVWSVVLGAWLLSEPLPPSLIWAMCLILIGVGLSQFGALKRLFFR